MRSGMIAQKLGMTRVFNENGNHVPVTVLQVEKCQVVDNLTLEKNGYWAVQVGVGTAKVKNTSKPMRGHFAKAQVEPKRKLAEFRVSEENMIEVGMELTVDHFIPGQFVDVTGTSIGKGFAGVIKRHNFGGLGASHGVSASHRSHGSTGQCQDPGRVFKGKKMAGHMGNVRVTTQNLKIVKIDMERGLILVQGAIPGSKGGWILIKDAIKRTLPDEAPKPGSFRKVEYSETPAKSKTKETKTEASANVATEDSPVDADAAEKGGGPETEKIESVATDTTAETESASVDTKDITSEEVVKETSDKTDDAEVGAKEPGEEDPSKQEESGSKADSELESKEIDSSGSETKEEGTNGDLKSDEQTQAGQTSKPDAEGENAEKEIKPKDGENSELGTEPVQDSDQPNEKLKVEDSSEPLENKDAVAESSEDAVEQKETGETVSGSESDEGDTKNSGESVEAQPSDDTNAGVGDSESGPKDEEADDSQKSGKKDTE